MPAGVLARLVAFTATLDPGINKHDRVCVLIALYIAEGITKGSLIRSALMELGYDGDHVAIMLKKGSGSMPPDSRWYREESGAYGIRYGPHSKQPLNNPSKVPVEHSVA